MWHSSCLVHILRGLYERIPTFVAFSKCVAPGTFSGSSPVCFDAHSDLFSQAYTIFVLWSHKIIVSNPRLKRRPPLPPHIRDPSSVVDFRCRPRVYAAAHADGVLVFDERSTSSVERWARATGDQAADEHDCHCARLGQDGDLQCMANTEIRITVRYRVPSQRHFQRCCDRGQLRVSSEYN